MLFLALVALLAVSCGPLDDEDNNPTATSETIAQPTTEVETTTDQGAAATPTDLPGQATSNATPGSQDDVTIVPESSPERRPPGSPATPVADNALDAVSTPEAPSFAGENLLSTPELDGGAGDEPGTSPAPFTGSDGTSGATPAGDGPDDSTEPPDASAPSPDGTPALDVVEESTPAAPVDLDAIEPVEVDSCEPADVPILIEGELSYVTTVDVNFRTGPGSDCDTIGDGPLGANVPVAVLSAPVVRQDEEEFVWVQIRVNDITGWVVVTAVEPAD